MWAKLALVLSTTVPMAMAGAFVDEVVSLDAQGSSESSHRVRILPFNLTLYPKIVLTLQRRDLIEELADDVLLEFLPTKLSEDIALVHINIIMNKVYYHRRQLRDDEGSIVQLNGGTAVFSGGEPSPDEVNGWVKDVLEENLLQVLQEETELNTVEEIQVSFLNPTATSNSSVPSRRSREQWKPVLALGLL